MIRPTKPEDGQLEVDEAFLEDIGKSTLHGPLPDQTVWRIYETARRVLAAAKHFREASSSRQRWCIVHDEDGHAFICPVEKREEALEAFEQIDEYWRNNTPAAGVIPEEPDFVRRVEGGLTFADPRD